MFTRWLLRKSMYVAGILYEERRPGVLLSLVGLRHPRELRSINRNPEGKACTYVCIRVCMYVCSRLLASIRVY